MFNPLFIHLLSMNTATGDNNKNQIRTYLSTRTIEARQTQPHDNQKYASFHVVAIMTLFLVTTRHLSRSITPIARAFTTTPLLQGRIGGGRDKDPRIKITLEQLRMAARGRGRGVPICHEQQEKIMNALEAAKYEVSCCFRSYC